MIGARVAAIAWCVAALACRGRPTAAPARAARVDPAAPAPGAAAPRSPRRARALVAPSPCAAITRGPGLEVLRSGLADLGLGAPALDVDAPGRELGSGSALLGRWPHLVVWLLGAELPGEPTAPRPVVDAGLRARGAALYSRRCGICHGARGDGRGPLAAVLVERPPQDFTTGVYKLRTTPRGSLPTDEDLFRTISRGVHGTPMLPWTNLSERDRWALVARLKAFAPDFAEAPPPTPIAIGVAPAATGALISRGRRRFQTAGCASCHGAAGRGDGPAVPLLRDAAGRPARPADLTGYDYRRGARMEDIYVTLRTGLDGTPMASYARALSPTDTWAIAAYVHSIAPRYVATASGVACPEVASVDAWEEGGARMALLTMWPALPAVRAVPARWWTVDVGW